MLGEQDGPSIFFGIHASIVVRELTVFWTPKGTCASTSLAGTRLAGMTVAQGADSRKQSISRWKVESAPGPTAPKYHTNS
jgi:hypothetical protein